MSRVRRDTKRSNSVSYIITRNELVRTFYGQVESDVN